MGRKRRESVFRPLEEIDFEKDVLRIFAFDTETKTHEEAQNQNAYFPSEFVFGTIFDGERFYDFTSRRKMAGFMCQLRWAGWVGFAANAEYDLNAIFVEPTWPVFRNYYGGVFKSARIEMGRQPRKGKRSRKTRKRSVTIFDTMQHMKGSVDKMAKVMGMEKHDMPDMKDAPLWKIRKYCRQDTRIVWEAMTRRQRVYNRNNCKMGASVAATTLDYFRRNHMDERHVFRRVNPRLLSHFKMSYHGARTEAFTHGWRGLDHGDGAGITFGDVNKMYLSCMGETPLPILRNVRGTRSSAEACRLLDRGVEGVARVKVEVPEDSFYPPLPARIGGQKLYFPVGEFDGVWPLNEIRHAVKHGAKIKRVIWMIYYPDSDCLFDGFAKSIYDLFQEAHEAGLDLDARTYKDFGNSLYGKWAMGGESLLIGPSWWEGKRTEAYGHDNEYRRTREDGPSTVAVYSNYIWAAYITASARCMIHQYLVDYQGLYTDTDSVATFMEVAPSKEMGALAWEMWARNIQFLAPKTYLCKNEEGTVKIRTKGISEKSVALARILTLEKDVQIVQAVPYKDMEEVAREYVVQRAMRFREGVTRGIPPNSWGMMFKEIKLEEKDRKRVHLDGGKTRPFTAKELYDMHGDWTKSMNMPWYALRHDPVIVATARRKEVVA
jgi:hypothetical protein